jgi:uncharacterized protein (UPF0261 family)
MTPGSNCAELMGVGGKWKVVPRGLTFLPLATPQLLASTLATANYTALNGYDDAKLRGCDIWALVSFQDFLTGLTSTASGTSVLTLNGITVGAEFITAGGVDAIAGMAIIPLTEKRITSSFANSFVGSTSHSSASLILHGYFA